MHCSVGGKITAVLLTHFTQTFKDMNKPQQHLLRNIQQKDNIQGELIAVFLMSHIACV